MKWSILFVVSLLRHSATCTPLQSACAATANAQYYDGSCWWKSGIGAKTHAHLVAMSPGDYCNEIPGGHLAQVMTLRVHQWLTTAPTGIGVSNYRTGLYRHNQTTGSPYWHVGWWWFDYFSMPPVLEAHDENMIWSIANGNPMSRLYTAASYLNTDKSYLTDTSGRAVLCQLEDPAFNKRFDGSSASSNRRLKKGSALILSEIWTNNTVTMCQVACATNRFCYSYAYSADSMHCQMHKPMPKGHNKHIESAMGYMWRDLTY